MLLVGFKPMISAGKWLQTYALDRATSGTGMSEYQSHQNTFDENLFH
jgi:hypothetical protein